MSLRDRAKQLLRMCGHVLTGTVHDRLNVLEQLVETDAALLQASIHVVENLHALAGRTIVEGDACHSSPEAALTAFLYSQIPARAAIEIERAVSGFDQRREERVLSLRHAGYEVFALEAGRTESDRIESARILSSTGAPAVRPAAIWARLA